MVEKKLVLAIFFLILQAPRAKADFPVETVSDWLPSGAVLVLKTPLTLVGSENPAWLETDLLPTSRLPKAKVERCYLFYPAPQKSISLKLGTLFIVQSASIEKRIWTFDERDYVQENSLIELKHSSGLELYLKCYVDYKETKVEFKPETPAEYPYVLWERHYNLASSYSPMPLKDMEEYLEAYFYLAVSRRRTPKTFYEN